MISVIIPAYNAEKYIEKCIQSILGQTIKNIEIIVVNDGSTDSTVSVCSKFLNNNFKLINKENEGPGVARETGLKIASGDYISFIDSDDYIEKDFYEKMMDKLNDGVEIVECGFHFVDEDGTILSSSNMYDEDINDCTKHYVLHKNTTNYLCNKIYKKELFDGIVFPKLFAGEDACVLLQLFSKAKKTSVISDKLYYYVQTKSSLCRKPYNLKKNDSIKAGIFMYEFCEKNHIELSDYYASYICMNAIICYAELKYSNIENKEKYMNEMKETYNKYLLKDGFKNLEISKLRKLSIKLFNISPSIASYIYKKVLKK